MGLGRWISLCPEAWAEDLGIWEKAVSWVPASEWESWHSEQGEARRISALRAPRVGWVETWRCKSSRHRKIVSLSPHVEKPLNSKRWIKVLCLNQFRECRVFRIPYVYFTHPYIWLCNNVTIVWIPSTLSHHPSLLTITLVGPLDHILCQHRADECRFLLVGQHWCYHVFLDGLWDER